MNRHHIEIHYEPSSIPTHHQQEIQDHIRQAISNALRNEGFGNDSQIAVAVLITGDHQLQDLNQRYAQEDHATDVLAFPARDTDTYPGETKSHTYEFIGDIAISAQQAQKQAEQRKWLLKNEIAMLATHATLHLLGYDHAETEEAKVMFAKTDLALKPLIQPNTPDL